MLKSGRLDKPYRGIMNCARRIVANEGVLQLWRGNMANVLRYFPTLALNLAFNEKIKVGCSRSRCAAAATRTASDLPRGRRIRWM